MKLIPALGSAEMQRAISHPHVQNIVDVLLQITDIDMFQAVALFLRNHNQYDLLHFTKDLQALQRNLSEDNIDDEGHLIGIPGTDDIIHALEILYNQPQEILRYQRGAIVELVALELVWEHCEEGECFSNHRFIDDYSRYKSDQVDVAVLSKTRKEIEGYACKMKSTGIESVD